MRKITIVEGLPGSGKTYYAKYILSYCDKFFDDPAINFNVWWDFCNYIINNESFDIVITDTFNLTQKARENLTHFLNTLSDNNIEIEWIFFDNDPVQCIINNSNIIRRSRGIITEETINMLSHIYTIPENSKVIPVWSDNVVNVTN